MAAPEIDADHSHDARRETWLRGWESHAGTLLEVRVKGQVSRYGPRLLRAFCPMARRDRDAGPAVGYRGIEKIAREKRVSMVEEMPLPEVHYFINSFVASFRLILDELNLTLDELK